MHLLHERLHGLESALAAEPCLERHAQCLAVEVALEVDQVCLDQETASRLELRTDADVDRGRAAVGPGGIDPVTGVHEALVRDQVRGREAQVAPALVAVDDFALDDERPAEHAACLLDVAGCDQRADLRGRHGLAVDLDQRRHTRLELATPAQHLDVALGALAEAEVLPDRYLYGAERPDQHLVDEVLGALGAEVVVERDDDQLLHPEPRDDVPLHGERVDQLRGGLGADHRERVRIEGQDGVAAADHLAMADVHAVERADRYAAFALLGQIRQPDDLHAGNTTRGFSRSSRGSAIARMRAPCVRRTTRGTAAWPRMTSSPVAAATVSPATATPCETRSASAAATSQFRREGRAPRHRPARS